MCIDTCSHSGYRITQLAPVNVTDPDSGTAAVASGEDSDIPAAQLRVVNDLLNMFNELQAGSEQIIQTRIIPDFMHSAE